MNDEEFGRTLLHQAFPSEPRLTLDLDQLVRNGRRAARNRRVASASGGTALVGLVGLAAFGVHVAAGWPTTGATSTSDSSSPSQASPAPCPSVELGGFVDRALPRRPLGAVKTELTTCTVTGGQVSSVEVWVELGKPAGTLHLSVLSSPTAGAQESAGGSPAPSCRPVSGGGTSCVTHAVKGGVRMATVDLTGRRLVSVTLTGSDSGGPLPLSDDELIAIVQAVAAKV